MWSGCLFAALRGHSHLNILQTINQLCTKYMLVDSHALRHLHGLIREKQLYNFVRVRQAAIKLVSNALNGCAVNHELVGEVETIRLEVELDPLLVLNYSCPLLEAEADHLC